MLELQPTVRPAPFGPTRPPGTPEVTEDGRPYVADEESKIGGKFAVWKPSPRRDGDGVYCEGSRIGTFRCVGEADPSINNEWIDTVPTKDMPPALAAYFRSLP
jgi:hypothetical protein